MTERHHHVPPVANHGIPHSPVFGIPTINVIITDVLPYIDHKRREQSLGDPSATGFDNGWPRILNFAQDFHATPWPPLAQDGGGLSPETRHTITATETNGSGANPVPSAGLGGSQASVLLGVVRPEFLRLQRHAVPLGQAILARHTLRPLENKILQRAVDLAPPCLCAVVAVVVKIIIQRLLGRRGCIIARGWACRA